ncbi:MAG TPA: hypothetical protein VIA29_05030 [Thermoanaerobaculia bacterium]
MRRVAAPVALLSLVGCQNSSGPTAPDGVRLGAPFLLRAGESAEIQSEAVRISFEMVTADRRCPSDVTCGWEGEARTALVFDLESEEPLRFELSTHQPRNADHAGYRTTLRRVLPEAPGAGERIPPSDYVVELQVDR